MSVGIMAKAQITLQSLAAIRREYAAFRKAKAASKAAWKREWAAKERPLQYELNNVYRKFRRQELKHGRKVVGMGELSGDKSKQGPPKMPKKGTPEFQMMTTVRNIKSGYLEGDTDLLLAMGHRLVKLATAALSSSGQ